MTTVYTVQTLRVGGTRDDRFKPVVFVHPNFRQLEDTVVNCSSVTVSSGPATLLHLPIDRQKCQRVMGAVPSFQKCL